jgi:acetamidase/formamidase
VVEYRLGIEAIHTYWDRDLPPRLAIEPGDTVVFRTREPSQGQVARDIAAGAKEDADPSVIALACRDAGVQPATGLGTEISGHALTGPVSIGGAEPGDTLVVEIMSVLPADWGWTSCGPAERGGPLWDELTDWYFHIWDLRSGSFAEFAPGIRVPMAPFCGVMGVAMAQPGRHRTSPPGSAGGNMDVRQLTAGSKLFLPVQVPGALISVGDAHAAQGDGEVAGTGIEMDATVTLRFGLEKGTPIANPQLVTARVSEFNGPWFGATGHSDDLAIACREALRGVTTYLARNHELDLPRALVLASACVDLKISQIVNAGVYTVSAFLPLSIFES